MPPPLPVLFTHFGEEWLRGSEHVLLDLLGHLDRDRITPVLWCNGAAMAEAGAALGVPTHRSEFAFYFDYPDSSPPFAPRQYLRQVREATTLIRRHDIRVLHANSAAPTQWLLPAAIRMRRPLLTHLHIGYPRRSRYALLLHQADLLVGVAAPMTRALAADGVPAQRLRTIHNGIDPGRLAAAPPPLRERLGLAAGVPLIGSIGSLILRKGHDLLLRALAMLPGTPPPHLAIAGSGPDEAVFRALAAELGLSNRVHFLGQLPDPGTLLSAVDIFALASRDEGLPLVLAEAGWCGTPAVAANVGGVSDILRDGETGLLVPRDDVPALSGAIGRLMADPALRHRLGQAAHAHVAAGFTVAHMAKAFTQAYEELARAPPRPLLDRARLGPYWRLPGRRPAR